MWLGDMTNGDVWLSQEQMDKYPALVKLGKQFGDFRNSPYRYDLDQEMRLNFGEIRQILSEASKLISRVEKLE